MRPAPPSEVAGPQGAAATGGYVAAGAPLLAVSSLRGADGVDDTAVKFLLQQALEVEERGGGGGEEGESEEGEGGAGEGGPGACEKGPVVCAAPLRHEGVGGVRAAQQGILFVQAEKEEEEEEADASYLLSSWPRSSSTTTVSCSSSTCGRCPCCAVQQQRRDLRRQFHLLFPVQVEWQGSQRAVGGVSVL